MFYEPNCWTRECKHFEGAKTLGKDERTQVLVCPAFPKGIPNEIAYEDDPHLLPKEGQVGDTVYEKKE